MKEQFARTQLLLGAEGLEKLAKARVAVFGIGGVGGYVVEALARSGVGAFDLIDNDTVCLSNLNRQIIATQNTIGQYKVDVMKERILSINPEAVVNARRCFYLPETADQFDFSEYSYVVDAVDTVTAKIDIIMQAQKAGVPVMSSMGAGNKLDPTKFQVADIYKTSVCPLAKVMRRELKKRGVKKLKVVYSTEEALTPITEDVDRITEDVDLMTEALSHESGGGDDQTSALPKGSSRRSTPGSIAFVPSVAGLIIAGEVIKDLIKHREAI
ncbi:MAG: tRNA threonylcarbamoyladenosine dehydratase [Lachnospiraceae bacterium]|nr:tRNA threonylcarbamoyladenosine dehydratase [Lachnospiraceae bacterium]